MAFDFPASPTNGQVYAPAGGPTYTWNGTAWVTISVGIPDAPANTTTYGRLNGAWTAVVPEAPLDGKAYLRVNGGWNSGGALAGSLRAVSATATQNQPTASAPGAISAAWYGGTGTFGFNSYLNPAGDKWRALMAGYASSMWYDPPTGNVFISRSTTALAKDADVSSTVLSFILNGNGDFTASGSVYALGGSLYARAAGSGNAHTWYQDNAGNPIVVTYCDMTSNAYRINALTGATGQVVLYSDGGFQISNNYAAKPGGGAWADTSDARIKTNVVDYALGLDEIVALRPVSYEFRGNDFSTDPAVPSMPAMDDGPEIMPKSDHAGVLGQTFVGLIAQEVEIIFPAMVTQHEGWVDGVKVDDLRKLDTGPLVFALINAVKELKARVEELEARG